MEKSLKLVKGDIVVVNFPFSDLSNTKKRPALVLASFGNELLLCQITSKDIFDMFSIPLNVTDFTQGKLNNESRIRPNKIFTGSVDILNYKIGRISDEKFLQVTDKIIFILKNL